MLGKMNNLLSRMTEQSREGSWTVFRILVAAMFITHGYAKLFGDSPQEPVGSGMTVLRIADIVSYPMPMDINLLFVAGVIELVGGVLILVGLWTHLIAFIALANMTMAYVIAHLAWFPTLNNGEMAALYWCSFLVLFTFGAGPVSADTWLAVRRQEKRKEKMEANS